MIKYYKELENPNDFTLPLLDDTFRNYKKLYDFHIPISFYDKHQLLFEAIKQIDFFIKCGNIEKRQKEIDCLYNQGTIDNEAYWNYCDTLAGFKNFQYEQLPDIEQLQKSLNINSNELERLIRSYCDLLFSIFHLWPDEEGILLQLNIVPIVKGTIYRSNINWSVE